MNLEINQVIKGRLAVITRDSGRSYDWGVYTITEEPLPLKDGDRLTVFERTGSSRELTVEFNHEFLYILGYEFNRKPVGVDLDSWTLGFSENKYVTIIREEESL